MLQTVMLYAVLVIAVVFDFWKCKIPNLLVLTGYVAGAICVCATDEQGYFYLVDSMLILLMLYPLFLAGAFGGGDIKLITCISVYMGLEQSIHLTIMAIAIGAVFSIFKIIYLLKRAEDFQFSHLYIHFSLPIAMATFLTHFFGGFLIWQIF